MPKNKKFIDRKNAVTFHLVHRSQQDPLTADESAPQRVLLPVKDKIPKGEKDKIKEEQQKYGIFYDDDYNYLQHLRDANKIEVDWEQVDRIEKVDKVDKKETPAKLNLPSSVFASNVEENVGLLNKAAPHSGLRLDLDPDIVAALDDDFDYNDPDNELEDNFMELANAEKSGSDSEYNSEDDQSDFNYSDEDKDEICSLNGPQYTFADEETKSRFTEYSMSSSVIRRNEQLTLLDERFEKMYESYDEGGIGPLDCEEIEGFVDTNSEMLLQCADEFARQQKRQQLEKDTLALRLKLSEIEDESDDEDLVKMEVKDDKEKWDCESILSTYSNIYNRPKLISEPRNNNQKIKINPRTGMPMNILGQNKLTAHNLSQLNSSGIDKTGPKSSGGRSVISQLSVLSIRPKNESPEERKIRKAQLKEYRRCRREEKKANAEAFKEEAKRQNKIAINNRNNVQGNRIL